MRIDGESSGTTARVSPCSSAKADDIATAGGTHLPKVGFVDQCYGERPLGEDQGMHYCQRCEPSVSLEPVGEHGVCPDCGWTELARRESLFVVTGASGSGKTAIFAPLAEALPECVVFDMDWLIDPMKRAGSVDWDAFRNAWLSVAHGIAQGRRSTVLLGPLMPEWLAGLPSRRWIGPIYFAVLDCTDDQRRSRLRARPSWREHAIDKHLGFAAHLRGTIDTVLDTGTETPEQTAQHVAEWIRVELRQRSQATNEISGAALTHPANDSLRVSGHRKV